MKQYTIIHPLYMSFYSKSLYSEVAREWSTRFCFLYLLSLLALCWIPGMIRIDSDVTDYIDNEAPKYVRQLPAITITKGQASLSEQQPYIIKDPGSGEPVMIIDTTGQITSLSKSKAAMLLTKTQLITRDGGKESRILSLSELGDLEINKDLVYDWLESFSEWFAIMLYPFAVLFSFAFRSLQVFIYALAGSFFLRGFKIKLNYRLLMRLGAISITPVVIFNTLVIFFSIALPLPWLINAMIAAGYLIFAVRSSMIEAYSSDKPVN